MADRTQTGAEYVGFLIPEAITEDDITSTLGVDYGLADPVPGPAVTSAATSLQLELSGTYDTAGEATVVTVRRAGGTAVSRAPCGVSYTHTDGETTTSDIVMDHPSVLTDYVGITDGEANNPSIVVIDDDHVAVVYTLDGLVTCARRASGGAWSTSLVFGAATEPTACACVAPDGSLLVYVVYDRVIAYRSTDYGATWTIQHSDAIGEKVTNADRVRACVDASGSVALFIVHGTSASDVVTDQYRSTDGGSQFSLIATSEAGVKVWDARTLFGYIDVITGESVNSIVAHYYRSVGSAQSSIFAQVPIRIQSATPDGTDQQWTESAAIGAAPWGRLYVMADVALDGLRGFYSDNGGASWVHEIGNAPEIDSPATAKWGYPSMVWMRGAMEVVVNDLGGNASAPGDLLALLRFGGHTDWPVSADMIGGTGRTVQRHYALAWAPVATLIASGWNNSLDDGTVTRTLDYATGERIQTGIGDKASYLYTSTSAGNLVVSVTARVISGTLQIYAGAQTADLYVELRSDQISVTDDGVDDYVDHDITMSATTYMEVVITIDAANRDATVKYRAVDITAPDEVRTYTTAATFTSLEVLTDDNIQVRIDHVGNALVATECYILSARVDTPPVGGATLPGGSSLDFNAFARCAIPLLPVPTWLHGDTYLQHVAGTPRVDAVTHTFGATSTRPLRNALPAHSPSPLRVWRSGDKASTDTITITLPRPLCTPILGVYLAGLENVSGVYIYVNGDIANKRLVKGSILLLKEVGDRTVGGAESGSASAVGWVRRDQLVGWTYDDDLAASPTTIVSNTEGSLTSGAGTMRRARLVSAGTVGSLGGVLLPPSLLALWHGIETQIETVSLQIIAQSSSLDRDVGILAVGAVEVVPLRPDLNVPLILDDNARIVTAPDETRSSRRRNKDRRRQQVAWVQSHHDVAGSADAVPDYIKVNSATSPTATWQALPYIVQGIVEAANGLPVVGPIPIAQQTSATALQVLTPGIGSGVDVMWCRITGGFRREALPYVGVLARSQAWRIPAIVLEEEL